MVIVPLLVSVVPAALKVNVFAPIANVAPLKTLKLSEIVTAPDDVTEFSTITLP